ncbi:hypothetical protein [Devosia sp. A449]
MALKWTGSLDGLKQAVTFAGRVGEWDEEIDPKVFRGTGGELLRYWPSTHSIQFQGKGAESFEADLKAEINRTRNTLDFGD